MIANKLTVEVDNQKFEFAVNYKNKWYVLIEGFYLYIDEIKAGKLSNTKVFHKSLSDKLDNNKELYQRAVEKLEQYLLLI